MPYICLICKEEFDKPASESKAGFLGRHTPMCPQGHTLTKLSGFSASFFWGTLLSGITYFLFYFFIFGLSMQILGESRTSVTLIALIWVLSMSIPVITGLVGGIRYSKQSPPLNKLSSQSYGFACGGIVAIAVMVVLAWNSYTQPVKYDDLVLYPGSFAGRNISLEGTVKRVTKDDNNARAFYELEETLTIVQTEQLDDLPQIGEKVWCFGRAALNRRGTLTLDEYFRVKK